MHQQSMPPTPDPLPLEALVARAQEGDRDALDAVVRRIQDQVYRLALRMLWHPADAEDATQEILVRIITHLGAFRGASAFTTWVYRVATNYLFTTRRRRAEHQALSFDEFAADLAQGLSDDPFSDPEEAVERLLVEEVKVGCMQAMLQCLSREERAAYVLGDIFGATDTDGAEIFGISPAAYRKRLSRARLAIRAFMRSTCGLVNPDNDCRCHRRVTTAIVKGRVDPDNLLFARGGEDPDVLRGVAEMKELDRAAALFRGHPSYVAPDTFRAHLRRLLESGQLSFLS